MGSCCSREAEPKLDNGPIVIVSAPGKKLDDDRPTVAPVELIQTEEKALQPPQEPAVEHTTAEQNAPASEIPLTVKPIVQPAEKVIEEPAISQESGPAPIEPVAEPIESEKAFEPEILCDELATPVGNVLPTMEEPAEKVEEAPAEPELVADETPNAPAEPVVEQAPVKFELVTSEPEAVSVEPQALEEEVLPAEPEALAEDVPFAEPEVVVEAVVEEHVDATEEEVATPEEIVEFAETQQVVEEPVVESDEPVNPVEETVAPLTKGAPAAVEEAVDEVPAALDKPKEYVAEIPPIEPLAERATTEHVEETAATTVEDVFTPVQEVAEEKLAEEPEAASAEKAVEEPVAAEESSAQESAAVKQPATVDEPAAPTEETPAVVAQIEDVSAAVEQSQTAEETAPVAEQPVALAEESPVRLAENIAEQPAPDNNAVVYVSATVQESPAAVETAPVEAVAEEPKASEDKSIEDQSGKEETASPPEVYPVEDAGAPVAEAPTAVLASDYRPAASSSISRDTPLETFAVGGFSWGEAASTPTNGTSLIVDDLPTDLEVKSDAPAVPAEPAEPLAIEQKSLTEMVEAEAVQQSADEAKTEQRQDTMTALSMTVGAAVAAAIEEHGSGLSDETKETEEEAVPAASDVAPAAEALVSEESKEDVNGHDYRPPTGEVAEHQQEDTGQALQSGGFVWGGLAPHSSELTNAAVAAPEETAPVEAVDRTLKGTALSIPPIIFVLGGPGAGKGTLCDRLKMDYSLLHVSTGDLLREEVKERPDSGISKQIQACFESGSLVPVSVAMGLLETKIKSIAGSPEYKGVLVDGFPRDLVQAEEFEKVIAAPSLVLSVHLDESTMTERLLKRMLTSGRADDNSETIKKRLLTFEKETVPVVEYYEGRKDRIPFVRVDASQSIEDVYRTASISVHRLLEEGVSE